MFFSSEQLCLNNTHAYLLEMASSIIDVPNWFPFQKITKKMIFVMIILKSVFCLCHY